jgi:hypothetical protein
MSKLTEYLAAATGYDSSGLPASTTQFTFGSSPFQIAETEDFADVSSVSTVCQSDAVVGLEIVDNIAKVTFDFSNETDVLVELFNEVQMYNAQSKHVLESLNRLMSELNLAERNGDEKAKEELQFQIRAIDVPFFTPVIIPVEYGGTVQVSFIDDPKFVFFTSEQLNQHPFKMIMIYEARALFCQDEVAVYMEDTEAEIRAQQEEMWYMDEARRMEEEQYQAQFGANANLYDDSQQQAEDKRLKGVRIK